MEISVLCPRCRKSMKFLPRKTDNIRNSYKKCVFCGNRIRVVDYCGAA